MITYNGLDLFSSGVARIVPGPLESRDAVAEVPDSIGSLAIGQGQRARLIRQDGRLAADDSGALLALIEAVSSQVGVGSATLIDEHGHAWPGCVMRRFEPSGIARLGPRVYVTYRIEYLQTTP